MNSSFNGLRTGMGTHFSIGAKDSNIGLMDDSVKWKDISRMRAYNCGG